MFRFNHHHQGAHYSCLLKLQLLKQPIIIHRCGVMRPAYISDDGVTAPKDVGAVLMSILM
jgi:hypothetical protein